MFVYGWYGYKRHDTKYGYEDTIKGGETTSFIYTIIIDIER